MLNAKLDLSIGTKKEKSLRKNQRTRGQKYTNKFTNILWLVSLGLGKKRRKIST